MTNDNKFSDNYNYSENFWAYFNGRMIYFIVFS